MSYTNPNVLPSGTSFAQFQAGGPSGHLERLIAANSAAELNPTTAATLSATAGGTVGGSLPPGVYYVAFTETNGYGETTPSPESGPITVAVQSAPSGTPTVTVTGSGGALSAGTYKGVFTYVDSNLNSSGTLGETTGGTEFSFTQTSGATPTITIGDGGVPSWASGRNLYLTKAGGASLTETLAFTGITTATFVITTNPSTSTATPPSTNTTSTNIPKITAFPALQPGNLARNIYLTAAGGGSGKELLYARDQTGTTFAFAAAPPPSGYAVALPTSNTTGYTTLDCQLIRAAKNGNLEDVYRRLRQIIYDFNHGSPAVHASVITNLKRVHNVFAVLAQACSEMGALIDANPGHIKLGQNGIGDSSQKRTWP